MHLVVELGFLCPTCAFKKKSELVKKQGPDTPKVQTYIYISAKLIDSGTIQELH